SAVSCKASTAPTRPRVTPTVTESTVGDSDRRSGAPPTAQGLLDPLVGAGLVGRDGARHLHRALRELARGSPARGPGGGGARSGRVAEGRIQRGEGVLAVGHRHAEELQEPAGGILGHVHSSAASGTASHSGGPLGLKLRVLTKCSPWWKFTLNFPPPKRSRRNASGPS